MKQANTRQPKRKRARTKAPPAPPPAATPPETNLGRNTLLTLAVQEKIVGAIRSGAYNETAAAYAGISERTFYNWLTRANEDLEAGVEPDNSIHLQFLQAVEKAQAESEIEHLLVIRNAAKGRPTSDGVPGQAGQWQAAAWMLERKHPDRFGRRIVQIPDPSGGESGKKAGKGDRKPQYFRFGGQILEI